MIPTSNKNIIITGASRGIGYATALELAKSPDHTIYALSRNMEKLKQLQQTVLEKFGKRNFYILPFDIVHFEKEHISAIGENLGHIDILINNAGKLINKAFLDTNEEDWQEIFNVNVFGAAKLIRSAVPFMEKSQSAHVVNISSMGGFQGSAKFAGLSAYSSSKAALASLTECLAEELKEKKIAVNCLALGAVQTEMLEEAFPGYQAPVSSKQMAKYIAWFSTQGQLFQNGKIIPLSVSTP
ncbi:MAG: SDR family oxidoreductase [Bacteroidetes bacterium]|nr:SDR family oxidoreductase [Bacteroidota bacterium]